MPLLRLLVNVRIVHYNAHDPDNINWLRFRKYEVLPDLCKQDLLELFLELDNPSELALDLAELAFQVLPLEPLLDALDQLAT